MRTDARMFSQPEESVNPRSEGLFRWQELQHRAEIQRPWEILNASPVRLRLRKTAFLYLSVRGAWIAVQDIEIMNGHDRFRTDAEIKRDRTTAAKVACREEQPRRRTHRFHHRMSPKGSGVPRNQAPLRHDGRRTHAWSAQQRQWTV